MFNLKVETEIILALQTGFIYYTSAQESKEEFGEIVEVAALPNEVAIYAVCQGALFTRRRGLEFGAALIDNQDVGRQQFYFPVKLEIKPSKE